MSITYCPRCDDAMKGDAHTEPACRKCMALIYTERVVNQRPDGMAWRAWVDGAVIGEGATEDDAISNLISAI